jgi:hypothetical protein
MKKQQQEKNSRKVELLGKEFEAAKEAKQEAG